MLRAALLRLRALLRRKTVEGELDDELRFHVERQTEAHIRAGMTPEEARQRARLQFGGLEQVKEQCRDARGVAFIESLFQDLRYGLRVLGASPGFTAVAVLSLALGIGANTAIFSLMDAVLLKTLPVKDPQQLVQVIATWPGGWQSNVPWPVFEQIRRSPQSFSGVFAFYPRWLNLRADGGAERVLAQTVSGDYYSTLGVPAHLGRTLTSADEAQADSSPAVVLSYAFWARRFGGDPAVVGKTVYLNGTAAIIIGVTPPDFFGADRAASPDITIPLGSREWYSQVWIMARLKPGVSAHQAEAEVDVCLQHALEFIRPHLKDEPARDREHFLSKRGGLLPADKGAAGLGLRYSEPLEVLIALTGLVLLIACANVANLLLARSAARSNEIGLRLAIGAGRGRLIRQLLTESMLLSVAGAALGVLFAFWVHRLLVGLLIGESAPTTLDFRVDYRVLAFTAGVSVLSGLLFGLAPALRATRLDLVSTLKRERRPAGAGFRLGLAKALLIGQVAASLLLLIGAGLFVRTLRNLRALDPGFSPESVLLVSVDAAQSGRHGAALSGLYGELIRRVEALPGVRSASLAGNDAFGGGWSKTVWIQGRQYAPGENQNCPFNVVGPKFFATVGVPVLMGREFGLHDHLNSPKVAIVNETFARKYWPGENPLGRRFGDQGPASGGKYEVIGVVKDTRYGSLRGQIPPMVYHALLQQDEQDWFTLHTRTAGSPARMVSRIRQEIQAIDRNLPVYDVRTLTDQVSRSLRRERMFATLSSFFGLLALVLTCVGLYGVIAYAVARRTNEIGVRMALGAERSDVLWMVLRETLLLVLSGAAIGVPAALAATGAIKKMLFGLTATDPATIAVATAVLIAVGVFAGYLPARRAASLDPTAALRHE